jgi:hypothetical protein
MSLDNDLSEPSFLFGVAVRQCVVPGVGKDDEEGYFGIT